MNGFTFISCEAALALAWAYEAKQRIRALHAAEQRQRKHRRVTTVTRSRIDQPNGGYHG